MLADQKWELWHLWGGQHHNSWAILRVVGLRWVQRVEAWSVVVGGEQDQCEPRHHAANQRHSDWHSACGKVPSESQPEEGAFWAVWVWLYGRWGLQSLADRGQLQSLHRHSKLRHEVNGPPNDRWVAIDRSWPNIPTIIRICWPLGEELRADILREQHPESIQDTKRGISHKSSQSLQPLYDVPLGMAEK